VVVLISASLIFEADGVDDHDKYLCGALVVLLIVGFNVVSLARFFVSKKNKLKRQQTGISVDQASSKPEVQISTPIGLQASSNIQSHSSQ
jgi:hypothetical protein